MSEPIRILCVFARTNRGGAETMCMNLYRNIDRDKIQFDFVKHTKDKCAYDDEILSLGGRIFVAPEYKVYNHLNYTNWWKNFFAEHNEYKIIHGHYYTLASIYLKIAKKSGLITIAHCHSTLQHNKGLKNFYKNILIRKIERYSDYCFACGENAGKSFFTKKEFFVLNNAIDTHKFSYNESYRNLYRKRFQVEEDFLIGAIGRFNCVKNPLGVIEIFEAISKRDENAKLLWIGDGELRPLIETKLKEKNLEEKVILTGVRSDIEYLVQAMDVFIMPSYYEGLPVVAIEAQASGLPCVFSTGVSKEADLTENCQFIPLDNYEKWAEIVLSYKGKARKNEISKIIDKGYDIKTTSIWLQNFYLQINKKERVC